MHLDVVDLRNFYYRSALGRRTQAVLRPALRNLWPRTQGMSVAGFGFAAPLLRPYLAEAERALCLMTGPQGVMPWPHEAGNVALLCEEAQWPVESGSLDRLLFLHGLETSEVASAVLDEAWRALAPEGLAVFIVPNRAGLWSRSDRTPFGYGRPYSISQLETQLRLHRFQPQRTVSKLFQPPSNHRTWRRIEKVLERAGRHLPILAPGGVLMVQATKQVASPAKPRLAERIRQPFETLEGIAQPDPA